MHGRRMLLLGMAVEERVSCLVSDISFEWQLESLDDGERMRISVRVEIPDQEAERLASVRDQIARSLARLAVVAVGAARG